MRWAWVVLLAVLLAIFVGLAAARYAEQRRAPGATRTPAALKAVPSAAALPAPSNVPSSAHRISANPPHGRVGTPAATRTRGCRLFGTITRGGMPQSDVQVEVSAYRDEGSNPVMTRTDTDGRYDVLPSPTGDVSVRVGGVVEWVYIPTDLNEMRQDFCLPEGAISGRVLERGTGKPVEIACVVAYRVDDSREATEPRPSQFVTLDSTDECGNYLLEGLPGGKYELRVTILRKEHVYGVVTLAPRGAMDEVDIYIGDPICVSGRVLDAASRPIREATVTLQHVVNGDPTLPPLRPVSCDDLGNFLLDIVTSGPYRVTAAATGHATAMELIRVDRAGFQQDFFLRIEATLRVYVKDGKGHAIEGASLAITDSSGEVIAPLPSAPGDPGPPRSGPNGEIQRFALREGTFRGYVSRDSAHATFDFKTEEGRETLLEVTLTEGN